MVKQSEVPLDKEESKETKTDASSKKVTCEASNYKSFLDTVEVDLTGSRGIREMLTEDQQKGVSLRKFMNIAKV